MKYFFSRGWKETGRVNLQSRTNKPRSTLVFTNLPSISSDFFGWCIFRLVLFCMKAGVMALDYGSWWKWTWSSRLNEQPKQLEKNPKKFRLEHGGEVVKGFLQNQAMRIVSPIFTENCSRRKLPCMTHTFSFAGKLLHTIRSRSSAIKMLASDWAQKIIREKHSSESWMWLVKSSIPGALSTVLENFRRRFSRPNWPPLGLRGWILVCTTFVTRR